VVRKLAISVALAAVMVLLVSSGAGASGADLLPDDAMTNLRNFHIDTTTMPGHTLLRFTAESVNIGAGPLELRGSRPDTSTPTMSVVQRIYDDSGGFRDVSVPSFMFWAGDGHNHWHVNDFISTELDRTDNGVKVGTGAKQGFCLTDQPSFDLSLPGAPSSPVYKTGAAGCAKGGQTSLAVRMGISVGWGDRYGYKVAFQWVDITGLTPGRYQLFGTVDAQNYYLESDETNNTTWVILQLNGDNTVKVIQQGPHV
jgi:Lysyl oxidase